MSYPQEWTAKNGTRGIAEFMIDGKPLRVDLDKFKDMQSISDALDSAFQQGRDSAKSVLLAGVEDAIHKFKGDFI